MANDNALARYDEAREHRITKRDDAPGFTESEVDLIKTQIAPGVTDGELKLFLHVCKSRQLDPFARQIYAVVRKQWNNETRTEEKKMTIMTAIDGFRLNAQRAGVEAIDEPEFEYDARLIGNSNPLGLVKATVKVWRRGIARPTIGVAYWDEFVQTKRDGSPSGQWPKMPRTMLAKCAEAQALRKAAPEELSGLYTPEEMSQADNESRVLVSPVAQVAATPVETPPAGLSESEVAFIKQSMDDAQTEADLKKIGAQIANTTMSPEQSKDLRAHYAKRRNKIAKLAREAAAAAESDASEADAEVVHAQFDE